MIEVIQFPKKCPHCKVTLRTVIKMHAEWMECHNLDCPFLATQSPPEDRPSYLSAETWEPFPYTFAFRHK